MNFSRIPNDSRLGRSLRLVLRLLPPGMVVPVLQGPLRGARWIVGSGTHGCWLGSYERDKQIAFARAVRTGDLVVDGGANVGFYTLLAARLAGPIGRVAAFEPVPRNLAYLRRHIALNRLSNVSIQDCALWSSAGTVCFDEASSPSQGAVSTTGSMRVAAQTLDSYLDLWGRVPDVVKLDIEGGEIESLLGADQILRQGVRTLFVESFGPNLPTTIELLASHGYKVDSLDPAVPLEEANELVAHRA